MIDFIKEQEKELKNIIKKCGYCDDNVNLVVSVRPDLGQYQYNGVMQLSKKYKENPITIANKIADLLKKESCYSNINVAGPGFINLTFSDSELAKIMENNRILNKNDENHSNSFIKKIIIDYGGPNIAKSLHVGHLRSANIGEALKRLAKFKNYNVISDVHLGDWGRPMGLIILELKKRHPEWPYFDENYKGDYPKRCPIKNVDLEKLYPIASSKAKEDENYLQEARIITAKLQQKERGYYELWKQIVKISTDDIKKIYEKLNVSFDLWLGESDADPYVTSVIDYLKEKNLVYESEGALVMDVALPDDTRPMPPLLLVKSNGAISYETTDLATLWQRMKTLSPDEIWYVVDKRQSLHFEQVFRAAYKSGIVPNNVKLEFVGFGTMNGKDGKPFKTRDGDVMPLLRLIEIVKEETLKKMNPSILGNDREQISNTIAISTLKYADLLPQRETDYIFDVERFCDLSGKTGLYLLYSTIRIKSLLDKAYENNYEIGPINTIVNNYDRDISLKLLEVNKVLNKSFEEKSLNDIAEYLYQLNNIYNSFYSSNKILSEKDNNVRKSWLGLSENVYNTNKKLLEILSLKVPNKI